MILGLSNCSDGNSADGYHFETTSVRIAPRKIETVLYPNLAALNVAFKNTNHRISETRQLMAFSVITKETCTIHMIDPKVRYMPEFLGHELTHCLYGEFHPSQTI